MTINTLEAFLQFVDSQSGSSDKQLLAKEAQEKFQLTKDRSVYSCEDFVVRFSKSNSRNFGNTVLSLSALQKYDHLPVLICLVTKNKNYTFLANSTFLKKVSHSSQELRVNNIRGSFNGSDIVREFEGTLNDSENIQTLFSIHSAIGFEGNLERLVEATNNIVPTGKKYVISNEGLNNILLAPKRSADFVDSTFYQSLLRELDSKVDGYKNEILLASLIENVNVRGRVIEYLVAGEDRILRDELISALGSKNKRIPEFKTDNDLGDFRKEFEMFLTETDVKTKVMILDSNPKAYNLDKFLEFHTRDRSVFLFYFIGIDTDKIASTALVSVFDERLLGATILLRHWAGRNSRGVSQFDGRVVKKIILDPSNSIDISDSLQFLQKIIDL